MKSVLLFKKSIVLAAHYCPQKINYPKTICFVQLRGLHPPQPPALKKGVCKLFMEIHLTATECHLPYAITQCYLPPDTSEHTLSYAYVWQAKVLNSFKLPKYVYQHQHQHQHHWIAVQSTEQRAHPVQCHHFLWHLRTPARSFPGPVLAPEGSVRCGRRQDRVAVQSVSLLAAAQFALRYNELLINKWINNWLTY